MPGTNPLRILRLTVLVALAMAVMGADCGAGTQNACPATGPCPPVDAAQAMIRGVVVDSEDNGVAGATVETVPPTSTVQTQSDGRFSIEVPPPIEDYAITVVARHAAFGEVSAEVVVTEENPTPEIRLVLAAPSEEPPASMDLRTLAGGPIGCIFEGDLVGFEVDVQNLSDAPIQGVVVHDTLSPAESFARPLESSDVIVDRERFPDAVVTVGPDGFSFSVSLGGLPPTAEASEDGFVRAYSVSLPASSLRGTRCNRIVGFDGDGAPFGEATGCVTETLAIQLDVVNEDGVLRPDGSFDATVETFHVGDGGDERPDGLVYRIEIRNGSCPTFSDARVVARLDPAGVVAYRGPLEGYPTAGTVTESSDERVVWDIGDLEFDAPVELLIRAEALAAGAAVHRIELSIAELSGPVIDEEPTVVEP